MGWNSPNQFYLSADIFQGKIAKFNIKFISTSSQHILKLLLIIIILEVCDTTGKG